MTREYDHWSSLAELASTRHGVFTRKQARESGVSAKRLRNAQGTLVRQSLSDVFVFVSQPDSFRQRCAIASAAGAVISHTSAAALHRLDGFNRIASGKVHVCFRRDHKRSLPDSYCVHTWSYTSASDIAHVDGIRCTSVARTLVQLGLVESKQKVEIALDSALRNGAPARWIEQTLSRLRRRGPTGMQVLEEIINDPGRSGQLAESALESIIGHLLDDLDLPYPVRQYEVALSSGTRRFDLAFPDAKLGIEGHSRRFHFGRAQTEADNLRDIELAAAGWEVLYITWGMAHEPLLFVQLLKQTYLQRHRLLITATEHPRPGS